MDPIFALEENSRNWALDYGNNDGPNLNKLALITNQTPQNIHELMHDRGFELECLPLYWLPQNTTEYENKTDAEKTQIDKDFRYILNSYIYDSGKYSHSFRGKITYFKFSANHGSICRLFNHRCDDEKGPMVKSQYVHTVRQDQRIPTIAFFAKVRQNHSFHPFLSDIFSVISKKAKKSHGIINYRHPIKRWLSVIHVTVSRQNVEITLSSTFRHKNHSIFKPKSLLFL